MEATAMTNTLPTRKSSLTRAGWAGVIGPALFTLTWVAQELFRIGEYSPIKEPVSALAAGPNGWIQSVNFAVFGVLTLVFAAGLYDVTRSSKPGRVGSALFLVSGIGLLMAAAFPLRQDAAGVTYDPGGHFLAGVTFFTSSALALVVTSFSLAGRAELRRMAMAVRVAGILMLLSNPVMGILVIPDDAPLHEWAGLAQRVIVLGLLFPARIALSIELLRTAASELSMITLMPRPGPDREEDGPEGRLGAGTP
jgi:hypothetical membrane protein